MTLLERVYADIQLAGLTTTSEVIQRLEEDRNEVMGAIKRLHKLGAIDSRDASNSSDQWFVSGPCPDIKVRKCLRCLNPFPSRDKGERICGMCKGSVDWVSGGDYDTPANVL